MGRKSTPPLSSQPDVAEAKFGMAFCCAPAPAPAAITASEAMNAAPASKDALTIAILPCSRGATIRRLSSRPRMEHVLLYHSPCCGEILFLKGCANCNKLL